MGNPITDRLIRSLCGQDAARKGEAYCRAGKVTLTLREFGAVRTVYEASVKENGMCRVVVEVGEDGEIAAECDCSAGFSFDKYCKHVAGALLQIKIAQRNGEEDDRILTKDQREEPPAAASEDARLVHLVLDLFKQPTVSVGGSRALVEIRTPMEAEFRVMPYAHGPRRNLLGIELRLGLGKRYAVPDIREFLDRFEKGEAYAFSRHFAYDPALYCFTPPDDAILVQLLEIRRNEKLQRQASGALYTGEIGDPRTLPVPPYAWEPLAAKLAEAPIGRLVYEERVHEGVRMEDEPLPVRFEFDRDEEGGYRLDVLGLENILFLDAYGIALTEGRFLKLRPDASKRLAELQKIIRNASDRRVRVPARQIEPFMERVVPGLIRLGDVRIARAVSDRIVQSPLEARVYLDRIRERLLVGLEFQYGDIVVNPLEDEASKRGENRILIREGEKEARILELIELAAFAKTESGYFLEDEEKEFDFLHRVVPQLEKLAKIYATSAVKERLHAGQPAPDIQVDLDERTNWLEIRFRLDGIPEDEIRAIIQSLAEKRKYHRLHSGALLPLDTAELQEMIRFLNETGLLKSEWNGSRFRLPVARGLHLLDGHGREDGGIVRLGESVRLMLDRLRHPERLEDPVPESLAPVLREYQRFGYRWLRALAHYRFGGILADDMGLGKTVQSIAFLVSVLPEIRARRQPALIVAPSSLMYNWRNELRKFAPEVRTVIADGSLSERKAILQGLADVDAAIVSYPLLRRDVALYAGQSFHTLILDEAQAFKNDATQTARAVKSLRAEYRFALTGTPIENSLDELRSIFEAVFPGLYPNRKAFGELSRETIANRARPFMLRRLKSDVLGELPEKIETLLASELLPEQKKLYAAYLAKLRHETLKHLDEDFRRNKIRILAGLTRLRQLCCHPALFIENYAGRSAKLEQLLETIDDCRRSGRRMLVFSQFTEMLGLIGRELGYRGVPFFYLDGGTPAAERVEMCARFNEGERDLFLISLKAGGTGLNLTGADTVILYDLWWNPAVEQQAEDRAHRIGQKKTVHVIRLVAQGTIEEKMVELQQKKRTLIAEVIRPGEEALSALTEQDIRELLSIE